MIRKPWPWPMRIGGPVWSSGSSRRPIPARRTAPADLAVVTPWYPSPDDPFAGAFVRAATAAVRPGFGRVSILHTQSWFYGPGRLNGQLLGVAAERQALLAGNAVVLDTAEGELTRVAVPSPAGGDHLAYADEQTRALRAALPTGRIEAPVVHAHVGILGGVVAARLARPDARLVVTEHATFLDAVLARPAARDRYARMLDRADLLLCVGRGLRDQLAGYFPEHAGKLRIVPNAIDFDRFAVRPSPPAAPHRWLYVGRLMEHKGVLTLIDAFTRVADPGDDPDAGRDPARWRTPSTGGSRRLRPDHPPPAGVTRSGDSPAARPRRAGAREPPGDLRDDRGGGGRHRDAGAGGPQPGAGRDPGRPRGPGRCAGRTVHRPGRAGRGFPQAGGPCSARSTCPARGPGCKIGMAARRSPRNSTGPTSRRERFRRLPSPGGPSRSCNG